ncbi:MULTISPECIES: ATP-binding domain-containing protein [unclassified Bradyrhizobium]|uniref:ATP-binding domain-containing protein n=1 Tax=unclassified Bradyrhizobium TaxID=2631580 RepID=UPI002916B49E|nr:MULTISPECIES: ATP-binding domain-containing protein [unclassified Bradyrhizobium]
MSVQKTPKKQEKPEVVASKQEFGILEKLSRGLSTTIGALLTRRPMVDRQDRDVEVALQESQYSTRKGYEELAKHCYGRTVIGEEIDENGKTKKNFEYRISQANVGFVEDGCNVLARNSPIASALVTADPGDESEVSAPGGYRYFVATEVRTFDGPTSLLSSTQRPNFRLMLLRLLGNKKAISVENLRAFVGGLTEGELVSDERKQASSAVSQVLPSASVWLEKWQGIYLGSSETSSLSHQFFTRTTSKQEGALNKPRGLTFVEGIAGSGKTSIALGRLKFFANFATGQELAFYGLRGAPARDFSPANMVGFVLSHSLRRYLKETASELGLDHLPIRDFQDFRSDLSNRYGLTKKFKRSQAPVSPYRAKLAWLLALDAVVAKTIGETLLSFITQEKGLRPAVSEAIRLVAEELKHAQIDKSQTRFNLHKLASRLVDAAMEAEYRARQLEIESRMSRETLRVVREDLREALKEMLDERDRRIVSPLGRSLLSMISVADSVIASVKSKHLSECITEAFEGEGVDAQELLKTINSFQAEVSVEDEKSRAFSDLDLVNFIVLSAMVADGFDRQDAPSFLYQMRTKTAAFIDEVQDFRETEVLLMGMVVTDSYHQITLSGDRHQQLQAMGVDGFERLFPFVPRNLRNSTVFLDKNFRQRSELERFSAAVRSVLLGDDKIKCVLGNGCAAALHAFKDCSSMSKLIVEKLQAVDSYATVAVITSSEDSARRWYELLRADLDVYHRPALLSRRDDLTRRNDVHFTEVREAKGLEFDVVIVPDLSCFDLAGVVGRNQLYVAVSRPRHSLLLGCSEDYVGDGHVQELVKSGIVSPIHIGEML